MLIVRATKKLRDRIGQADLGADERSTTALGDWYATRFAWRPDVLLLVNESTLMPVLLPLAPAATALARAADRIAEVMAAYGASEALVAAELDQMKTRGIGATANRSVVGVMTEFSFLADVHRTRNHPDLDDLAGQLATTPCSPLYRSHISPTGRSPCYCTPSLADYRWSFGRPVSQLTVARPGCRAVRSVA